MTDKNPSKQKILVIAGPTAVGKTAFACHAADEFDGEIISCDSMQIYRGLDIGTAKPSREELALHPHHLIDIIDPDEEFSAARYVELARARINEVAERGKLPIICGGTGLYLDGIIYEMDYGAGPEDEIFRRTMETVAETEGPTALHKRLKDRDPLAAEDIHPNNTKRIIRALERIHLGEESLKAFSRKKKDNPSVEPLLIGLERPRKDLYDRINQRVDQMIDGGLIGEVEQLLHGGIGPHKPSMQAIGYKEIVDYFDGRLDYDASIDRIKTGSRHYAKRQFTWFRRYDKMKWLDISEYDSDEKAMEAMDQLISEWLEGQDL